VKSPFQNQKSLTGSLLELPGLRRSFRCPSSTQERQATSITPPEKFSTPEKLSRQLSGDLDRIVFMAMRREAPCDYASAEELADD
jgi:hypothetical protein